MSKCLRILRHKRVMQILIHLQISLQASKYFIAWDANLSRISTPSPLFFRVLKDCLMNETDPSLWYIPCFLFWTNSHFLVNHFSQTYIVFTILDQLPISCQASFIFTPRSNLYCVFYFGHLIFLISLFHLQAKDIHHWKLKVGESIDTWSNFLHNTHSFSLQFYLLLVFEHYSMYSW